MDTLIYLGKVNLYWILLYTCYHLVLRKHTFFELNRAYLLTSLLLAFALPLIIYPATAPPIPVLYEVSSAPFTVSYATAEEPSVFTRINLGAGVYGVGVIMMLFQFLRHLRQLGRFLSTGELVDLGDCKVVLIDSNNIGSFSFLKWIVVNRTDYEYHFDAILRHEMVHTRQWHSADILFLEILKIVFWFNPVFAYYKTALQEVHEFLADSKAPNRENYATFLLSYALNAPVASLTNHFFKPSQIKTRIEMIYKNRTSKWLIGTYFASFSIIGTVAIFVAGCDGSDKSELLRNEVALTGKNITVQGEIKGANGLAIPGADIEIKGIERGTSTDMDGKFQIDAPDNSELIISFPDHTTQVVKVKPNTKINIVLGQGKNNGSVTFSTPEIYKLPVQKQDPSLAGKKIYTVVQQQPVFPGGTKAMYKFLGDNIKYPAAASRARVSGRVFLSFVVSETGEIKDVNVLKGLGFGCDEEAIRVLKAFPSWIPGTQDGTPVNVKYNLPINFQLKMYDKAGIEKSPLTSYQETELEFKNADGSTIALAANGRIFHEFTSPENKITITSTGTSPIYILNGKILKAFDLNNVATASIKKIEILKSEYALAKYGESGKNGVVVVATKTI